MHVGVVLLRKATLTDVVFFLFLSLAVYAKVLPKNHTEEGEKHKIRVYDLEILKIYKGVDFLIANQTNVTVNGAQVNSSSEVGLPAKAYASGVKLKHNTEYLLIGIIKDEKIRLNLGSMLEQWSQVTSAYRAGISGIYAQNCECQITPCFGKPCKPLKGCDVPPRQLREFYQGCEWRHSYCVENEAGSACSWHETAEYITCTSEIP